MNSVISALVILVVAYICLSFLTPYLPEPIHTVANIVVVVAAIAWLFGYARPFFSKP